MDAGAWHRLHQAARPKPAKEETDDDTVAAYQVKHLAAYTEVGIAWPPQMDDPEFLASSSCLPDRAKEVLWYDVCARGPASSLNEIHVRDLHMSIDWGNARVGHTPTITCSSTMWCRGQYQGRDGRMIKIDRKLCGAELLALQGLPAWRWRPFTTISDAHATDMAGNAFCFGHLLPIIVSLVACVPWKDAFETRRQWITRAEGPPQPAACEEERNETSLEMSCEEDAMDAMDLEGEDEEEDDGDVCDAVSDEH